MLALPKFVSQQFRRSSRVDFLVDFLAEDRISNDEKKASKVCRVASHYWLSVDMKLYRRAISFMPTFGKGE